MEDSGKRFLKLIGFSSLFSGTGCIIFIAMFFVIAILFGIIKYDNNKMSLETKCVHYKSADEICKSITVIGKGTMSFDDYIAGVVGGEVGVFSGHPEIQKALAVAARTYSVNAAKNGTHGASIDANGNCTVPTGENFQVYNAKYVSDSNIMSIVQDTSGQILVDENGNTKSTEYDSILIESPYDSSGNEVSLKQRGLSIPKSWLEEVNEFKISCPKYGGSNGNLNSSKNGGYGCGHGRGMGQWGGLYLEMEKNYDMVQILDFFYGEDTDYKLSLASSKGAGTECTSESNNDFGTLEEYNLNHNGLTMLSSPLSKSDIDDLNEYIEDEMDKNDSSYNSKVAAAGQGLVYWFEKHKKYLGYYWGGGHEIFTGAHSDWGNTSHGKDEKGNQYFGMDCSGFVSWSIRNACKADFSAVAENFLGFGNSISLDKAKPGDVVASEGHVMLVVKNNGDGTVTVAEEGGSSDGLVFSTVDSNRMTYGNRSVIDMSTWYKNNCS